jgi:spermidine/putrescine transport system permease protein
MNVTSNNTGRKAGILRNRGKFVDLLLQNYTIFIFLFLYIPIAIVVLLSFNAGDYAAELRGFSMRWYGATWRDPFVLEAFRNSILVASVSATLATIFGTMAALALQRVRGLLRQVYDGLTYIAIIVPGIVIGISTLIFFVQFFEWLNPWLTFFWESSPYQPPHFNLGLFTIIAAHTLFTMSIVLVIVRARITGMDRSFVDASSDLYATPWGTFVQVTLPLLLPAILAGFLLAFTFSFDDFIIAFFVAGPNTTLPMYVFSSIRRGITPKINTIATVTLMMSFTFLIVSQFLFRSTRRRSAKSSLDTPLG